MAQDGPGNGEVGAPAPSAATEGLPEGFLVPGQVLGDRYQIKSQLGRGGMGEVWRAFDLKLRVEVALKAMLPDLFKDERRRDLLRREVRAAREVVSPNVCRIFDLIEVDGTELVSMEYVDGGTLLSRLAKRGPLDLKEAQDIASQFLAGLEAIHQAGLVHRDVKPENIMITRAGRVVLMDFGLARQEDSGAGTVAGTPAYMAPEQAAGLKVDARADVYSAGVVLAEMVSPDGIKDFESRQSVWEGIRQEPAQVPDSPWAPVLKKAVAKEPDQRQNSAHTLIRELEDVTLRVEGAEDLTPYPGLASFTEEDAEYFFGREAEVEAMWAKLEGPARLLALVGPSGAGKTSFLRAGLIPSGPPGWSIVRCTPGSAPSTALGQALVPELSGNTEAIQSLIRVDEADVAVEAISVWRNKTDRALLIVDQFEELFTLNTFEAQKRFAALLARVPLEADADVLLCMRDDFLIRCHDHEALTPIFDALTPLKSPSGANLRRALMQPATKCGYRFEDDELVNEMLDEVEGERGALPLLAFAMSRLWEMRDRENGVLTRQSYLDIGGVGGALARHAEATIDRIGVDRLPIVRELFRNLVTAEGTRAVREWDELLSVFDTGGVSRAGVKPAPTKGSGVGAGFIPARDVAQEVLRELIDARLLTSYEVQDEDREPARRVEIIHESLLANWPRLVRWQTQDQEGAQIRDELRQAARSWDEHGRHDDRLWTGTAFREYVLWRERYPGGLTEIEEAFGSAMTSLATRRRRRRRIAVAAGFAILLAGLAIVVSFWQRSVQDARRAEAAELFAFGQLEIEEYPTAAVAYAIASLELADRPATRRLALDALWKGPPAMVVNDGPTRQVGFTSDGHWLIESPHATDHPMRIFGSDGSRELLTGTEGHRHFSSLWSADGGVFLSNYHDRERDTKLLVLWSPSERRKLAEALYESGKRAAFARKWTDNSIMWVVSEGNGRYGIDTLSFDGAHRHLGTRDVFPEYDKETCFVRMNWGVGHWLAATNGHEVFVSEMGEHGLSEPRLLGRQPSEVSLLEVDPLGRFIASADSEGRIHLWDLNGTSLPEIIQGPTELIDLWVTRDGRFLRANSRPMKGEMEQWIWSLDGERPELIRKLSLGEAAWMLIGLIDPAGRHIVQLGEEREIRLWNMSQPADAEPLNLLPGEVEPTNIPSFHPQGRWLAAPNNTGFTFWSLNRRYPSVIRKHDHGVNALVFGSQGEWLASASSDGSVRIWPLVGEAPPPGRVLFESSGRGFVNGLARSPTGDRLLVASGLSGVHQVSIEGNDSRALSDSPRTVINVSFSPNGSLAAAAGGSGNPSLREIDVWKVETGERIAVLAEGKSKPLANPQFVGNDHLMALDQTGLRRWNIGTGESKLLYEGDITGYATTADRSKVVLRASTSSRGQQTLIYVDLEHGAAVPIESHGDTIQSVKMDPEGEFIVTGDVDGTVRVGPVTGEEPHILLGHKHSVNALAVDPLERWIASGSEDRTIRLWPMPDLSTPPLHTLPRDEIIAKLKSLTNLRVVRDDESPTGWNLTHDPFPGWETVPTW
jgi:WD40 repeat protein